MDEEQIVADVVVEEEADEVLDFEDGALDAEEESDEDESEDA